MAGRRTSPLRRLPPRTWQVLQVVLSVLVVAALLVLLFRRVDFAAVWAEIRDMSWLELATVAAIAAWNLLTYWALWVAVTPGLRWSQAAVLAQSGTAVTNTVPGGSAIGVRLATSMLESWSFSRGQATLAILISGVWNSFIKLSLPVLALALVALQGDASRQRVVAGLIGIGVLVVAIAVFTLVLRSDAAARRVGELAEAAWSRLRGLVRKPPVEGWDRAIARFRSRATGLLRHRWPAITAAALVSHLSLYLVLLVALRHVGVTDAEVGWAQVLAVFAFARLVTAVRFTPGGAGVVEAVLIAGLVASGGAPAPVTGAVLVFRLLTWLLPVPIGTLTYLGWRRRHRTERRRDGRAERGERVLR